MATINITINDAASQQEPGTQLIAPVAESQAPGNGGGAPVDDGSDGHSNDGASLSGAVAADGLVDIGSPPSWLYDAIAAAKASEATTDSPVGSNSDGGAAPTE